MSQPGRASKAKGTARVKAASAASTVGREQGVYEVGGDGGGQAWQGLVGKRDFYSE